MNVTLLSTILMQLHSVPPTGPPTSPANTVHYDVSSISPTRALMGLLMPYHSPPRVANRSTVTTALTTTLHTTTTVKIDSPLLFPGHQDTNDAPINHITPQVVTVDNIQSTTTLTSMPADRSMESNNVNDTYITNSGDILFTLAPVHHREHPVPPSYGKGRRPEEPAPTSEREPGPYFRPPGAISKYHRTRNNKDDFDPNCFPRCLNYTNSRLSSGSKRKRKHSQKEKNWYNYKLLYDTIKDSDQRKETEFYAWIFGATMLGLGSITTLTSCFAFCFCSDRWRKRKKTKTLDQSGDYQRVDSVSSMVSHADSSHADYEPLEPMDDITVI